MLRVQSLTCKFKSGLVGPCKYNTSHKTLAYTELGAGLQISFSWQFDSAQFKHKLHFYVGAHIGRIIKLHSNQRHLWCNFFWKFWILGSQFSGCWCLGSSFLKFWFLVLWILGYWFLGVEIFGVGVFGVLFFRLWRTIIKIS